MTPEPISPVSTTGRNLRWLAVLAAATIFVASFFTLYRPMVASGVFFSADTVYLASLYKDLIIDHNPLKDWMLTPASFLIPDGLLYFLTESVVHNFQQSLLMVQGWMALLLVAGTTLCARWVAPVLSFPVRLSVSLVLMASILQFVHVSQGKPWEALLLLGALPGFHIGLLVLELFALAALLRLVEQCAVTTTIGPFTLIGWLRLPAWWALAALSFAAFLSDSLYIVHIVLPSILVLGWLWDQRRRPESHECAGNLLLAVLAAYGAGYVVNAALKPFIFFHDALGTYTHFSWGRLLHSIEALWMNFQLVPIPYLVAMGFYGVMLVWGLRLLTRPTDPHSAGESLPRRFGVLFLAVLPWVTHGILIFFGKHRTMQEDFVLRYLLPVAYLPLVVMSFTLVNWLSNQRSHWPRLAAAGVLLAGIGLGFAWPTSWTIPSYTPPTTACLDKAARKYHLHRGVTHYWNAKVMSLFSREGLRLVSTLPNFDPARGEPYTIQHWISSLAWVREGEFDFLVYNPTQPDRNLVFSPGQVWGYFGQPNATVDCYPDVVWIYQNNPKFARQFSEGRIRLAE